MAIVRISLSAQSWHGIPGCHPRLRNQCKHLYPREETKKGKREHSEERFLKNGAGNFTE